MKKLPKNTQFYLSSLMEEKIKSHPNDWNVYFKNSYKEKFYKLTEDKSKKELDPQEEAKKRLEQEQKEQEEILRQAQADLDRATANAMLVDEPETPETAKSGISAIGGGYGGGPPAKKGELSPNKYKTMFGDELSGGRHALLFPLMAAGKALGMAGTLGAVGANYVAGSPGTNRLLGNNPLFKYAVQTLGSDVGRFLQAYGANIENIIGPEHALKGAEEVGLRNAINLVQGAGKPFFPIPISYKRQNRDVENYVRSLRNQPQIYQSDLDDYWRYQNTTP